MTSDEALDLLCGGRDRVMEWNRYRTDQDAIPSLSKAFLRGANLSQANLIRVDLLDADLFDADLSEADLSQANLGGADLRQANLSRANLHTADLGGANLSHAILSRVNFGGANLAGADLTGAQLVAADLSGAALCKANLSQANLGGTDLSRAELCEAIFKGARCTATMFADVDLSGCIGLDLVKHWGPSTIGTDTLIRSCGKISEAFLRGCGLSPWECLSAKLYDPALNPPGFVELQYQTFDVWTKGRGMTTGCFISYSWKDAGFAETLRVHLMAEGINVWLDRHDIVAGTIHDQLWRAIQLHHVVILILSEDSARSDWVESELEMARDKEQAERRAVLCPVALDDAWKAKVEAKGGPGDPSFHLWRTLKQKAILDFSGWETGSFDGPFAKLLKGLKVNY